MFEDSPTFTPIRNSKKQSSYYFNPISASPPNKQGGKYKSVLTAAQVVGSREVLIPELNAWIANGPSPVEIASSVQVRD